MTGPTTPITPGQDILQRFDLTDPVPVIRTKIASIWRVRRRGGDFAALKLYHRSRMGNEAAGVDYLRGCGGVAAAHVYQHGENVVVLEWLAGASLGDMARGGRDAQAARLLADVAASLRGIQPAPRGEFPRLGDWLGALFGLEYAPDCPADLVRDLEKCKHWGRGLLGSGGAPRVLHGDLHHDNVRLGARGYCAFDAKGVLGEPCYELANAFRNPLGTGGQQRDPGRINLLADIFAQSLGALRGRLLGWAAVKCALSIAWRSGGRISADGEADLLAVLLAEAESDGGAQSFQ